MKLNKPRKSFLANLGDGKCGFWKQDPPEKLEKQHQGAGKGPHRYGH